MDRPETLSNTEGRAQGAAMTLTSLLGVGAFLTALAPQSAVNAQSSATRSTSNPVSIVEITTVAQTGSSRRTELPASTRSVMERAATMLQAVQARQGSASSGARQSYQAAAAAFQQVLTAGHYSTANLGRSANGVAGLPLSSTQIASDIRTLKAAMRGASPSQSAALQQVAGLYATGAKEFFTGQLRDALFSGDSGSAVIVRGGTSRSGSGTYGTSSSTVLGKTVVPRGVQRGGVIQPDGTISAVGSAPQVPDISGATPPTPSNTVGTNVVDAPPLGISPTVLGGGNVLPVNPVSPVGGTTVIVTPPVTPAPTTPAPTNPSTP